MAKNKPPVVTAAEYLQADRSELIKTEYYGAEIFPKFVDGKVSPIVRDHEAYDTAIGKVRGILEGCLDVRKQYLFQEHVRLWTQVTNSYLYPEFIIGAQYPQYTDELRDTVLNPAIVIDLSRNLNAGLQFDRKRFPHFRWIPGLTDYVYINQVWNQVIHYTKREDHWWLKRKYEYSDEKIELRSIQCTFSLADIYNDLPPWTGPP